MPNFSLEMSHGRDQGCLIAGVDEVGRGPLAGPVVAACVVFLTANLPRKILRHVKDSKQLKREEREELFPIIAEHAVYGIASASVEEIDGINILQASLLAMKRAVEITQKNLEPHVKQHPVTREGLFPVPGPCPIHLALIDGNHTPKLACKAVPVIGGDGKSLSIAAASILAKVTRDKLMIQLHNEFPQYDWLNNAGYGTPFHLAALAKHGITPHHRRSFAPVRMVG
jgi:ribonuclease HII